MRYILILFIISSSTAIISQSISAEEIIRRSIEYHDPQGKLLNKYVTLYLTETRPNGKDRKSEVSFHLKKEKFQIKQEIDNHNILSKLVKGKATFQVDGQADFSNEIGEKFRLNGQRVNTLKNYYQYLWLMPMKIMDEGSNLNPLVKSVDFFGKLSLEVRVTYDPDVGSDVWYFYFNPESYSLQGYRFYHDEEKNDGEYIILEEEVTFEHVRLPKERKWYTHKEDKFLGADILEAFSY